jgi:hypothetical protein
MRRPASESAATDDRRLFYQDGVTKKPCPPHPTLRHPNQAAAVGVESTSNRRLREGEMFGWGSPPKR